jgi:hypothetical protein
MMRCQEVHLNFARGEGGSKVESTTSRSAGIERLQSLYHYCKITS